MSEPTHYPRFRRLHAQGTNRLRPTSAQQIESPTESKREIGR